MKLRIIMLAAATALLLDSAPARADFCIQLSQNLSGSLGFLQLRGGIPKSPGKIAVLKGRRGNLNDYGPAFGGATVLDDATCMSLYVHFTADPEPGQVHLQFCPTPPATTASLTIGSVGTGRSTYGETVSWANETGTIVACP